jgi:hypothetical protein
LRSGAVPVAAEYGRNEFEQGGEGERVLVQTVERLSMEEVKREAHRRTIGLAILPTTEAIQALQKNPDETNALLRVTC